MNDDGLLELDFDDDDEVNVHGILKCKYNVDDHYPFYLVLVILAQTLNKMYGSSQKWNRLFWENAVS